MQKNSQIIHKECFNGIPVIQSVINAYYTCLHANRFEFASSLKYHVTDRYEYLTYTYYTDSRLTSFLT